MKIIVLMMFFVIINISAFSETQRVNAVESGPSLAHLVKFVGKGAFFEFNNKSFKVIKGNSLIDDQSFRHVLLKALGKKRYDEFMEKLTGMYDDVKQKGQILYFHGCEQHNTAYFSADVFINISDNSIEVYWHTPSDGPDYWLSSQKKPRAIKKDIYNMEYEDDSLWILKRKGYDLFTEYSNTEMSSTKKETKESGPLPIKHGLYIEEHQNCQSDTIPIKFQLSYDGKGLTSGMVPKGEYKIIEVYNNDNTYHIKQKVVGKGGVRGCGEFTWEATIIVKNNKEFSIVTNKVNNKSYEKMVNTYRYCP